MILEGDLQRAWQAGEKRESRMVFIGRDLPRGEDQVRLRKLRCLSCLRHAGVRSPPPNLPSLTDRARTVNAGAPVVGVHFLAGTPVFVLGDKSLLFAGEQDEVRVPVHRGAILSSTSDGERIVTGGDDGRVVVTSKTRARATTSQPTPKKRWIDQLALGPDGAVAWSAGKTRVRAPEKRRGQKHRGAIDGGGSCFCAKGIPPSRSHTTTACRCGFPTLTPSRKSSNGRARTSPWRSARTAASSSPPCRNRPCMAGGWWTASTCACRATQSGSFVGWTSRR